MTAAATTPPAPATQPDQPDEPDEPEEVETPTTPAPPATPASIEVRSLPPVPAAAASSAAIDADEATGFLLVYYDAVNGGRTDDTWPALSEGFRADRSLSFGDYQAYWRETDIRVDNLRYTPGPAENEARVRFDAAYSTGGTIIRQVDEITLRRQANGQIQIVLQRRID